MIKKLSYVMMSVLYFNLFFMFCYYFKIVDFLNEKNVFENSLIGVMIANFILILFDAFYILLFKVLNLSKMPYFCVVINSVFLGFIISFILFKTNYNFSNYLSVISFFTINVVFLHCSLKFEKEKNNVFG